MTSHYWCCVFLNTCFFQSLYETNFFFTNLTMFGILTGCLVKSQTILFVWLLINTFNEFNELFLDLVWGRHIGRVNTTFWHRFEAIFGSGSVFVSHFERQFAMGKQDRLHKARAWTKLAIISFDITDYLTWKKFLPLCNISLPKGSMF